MPYEPKQGVPVSQYGMASSGVRPIYQSNYNENAYTNFSHPAVYPQCNALNNYSNSIQPYSTQYPNTGILVKPSPVTEMKEI